MCIAEIETDKATMEVEAVDEGTLLKIVVPEGTQGVKVNAVIAVIGEAGEALPSSPLVGEVAAKQPEGGSQPAATPAAPAAPAALPPSAASGGSSPTRGEVGERTFASPLARRIAKDAGVDVSAISGSGPKGRVVKSDVEAAIAGGGAKAAPAAAPHPLPRQPPRRRACRTTLC